MTPMEKIREFAGNNQPLRIHLADARVLEVQGRDWISTHPSGQGTSLTVYGPGDDEEHWIPIFAITRVFQQPEPAATEQE